MVKIKFCGIKRLVDVLYCNDLMVDYVGFVFAESKRKVDLETAEYLCTKLDKRIKKVGVFVNEKRDVIRKAIETVGLDIVQLHGNEDVTDTQNYDVEVWKAVRVKGPESLNEAQKYKCRLLLDTYSDKAGGTGLTFDWNILKSHLFTQDFVLAGGLDEDNVLKAINMLKPYAVDVSSGIETDGCKDYLKMKRFVERVRSNE